MFVCLDCSDKVTYIGLKVGVGVGCDPGHDLLFGVVGESVL